MADVSSSIPIIGAFMNAANQSNQSASDFANQRQAADMNYAYSRELAKYQNDLNMLAWTQQQQYNTPANQMARFKAAGLNPNLIYGQGNSGNASSPVQLSAGSARHMPTYQDRTGEALAQAASTYLDMKAKTKQLEILDSDAKIKENDALISDDRVLQSGYLTYGDMVGRMAFQSGRNQRSGMNNYSYLEYNSPFAQQLDIKAQDLQKRVIENRLRNQFAESERSLKLQRDRQAFELERYTRDPLFYYGNKAIDKLLDFLPKRKGGSFNPKFSPNGAVDKLRGMGYSVRKGVYPR